MGRPHRIDPEHGIHHVYSRGTRRWTLYIDQLDYERFMRRLGAVCMRYGISIYAYCLMGNHFHLVISCPAGFLSEAMHDLKFFYAREHNDRHSFSGPLFESRFGSKLVMDYQNLRTLVRYVHRNPLSIDSSINLGGYPWSSHAYYLEASLPRPEWLDVNLTLGFFKDRVDYRQFVETNVDSDETRLIGGPQDARQPFLPAGEVSVSAIILTVAALAGCEPKAIRPRMRNGLAGVVLLIAQDVAHYTSAELRDACGYGSTNAVTNAKREAIQRVENDPALQALVAAATARLRTDS